LNCIQNTFEIHFLEIVLECATNKRFRKKAWTLF